MLTLPRPPAGFRGNICRTVLDTWFLEADGGHTPPGPLPFTVASSLPLPQPAAHPHNMPWGWWKEIQTKGPLQRMNPWLLGTPLSWV